MSTLTLQQDEIVELWQSGNEKWNEFVSKYGDIHFRFNDIDFSKLVKKGDVVSFRGYSFPGVTTFHNNNFSGVTVDFRNASISKGKLDISGKFQDCKLLFSGIQFVGAQLYIRDECINTAIDLSNVDFTKGPNPGFVRLSLKTNSRLLLDNAKFGAADVNIRFMYIESSTLSLKNCFMGEGTVVAGNIQGKHSKIDFSNADFSIARADFSKCKFEKCDVSFVNTIFSKKGVDFSGVDFGLYDEKFNISVPALFKKHNFFRWEHWKGAYTNYINYTKHVKGNDGRSSRLNSVDFTNANFSGIAPNFKAANVRNVIFNGTDLRRALIEYDKNYIQGAILNFESDSKYLVLKRNYSGPLTFLIIFLAILTISPYVVKTIFWGLVGSQQQEVAAVFQDITGKSLFADYQSVKAVWVALGLTESKPFLQGFISLSLIAYATVRSVLTFKVATMESKEKNFGLTPLLKEYSFYYKLHQVLVGVGTIAFITGLIRLLILLAQPVLIPN